MSKRDARFAELDRLIAAGLGDVPQDQLPPERGISHVVRLPRAPRGSNRKAILEAVAATMRSANAKRKGRRGKGTGSGWWIEGKWVPMSPAPWEARRPKYLREKS